MLKLQTKSNKGFTLIELLVVISIIALLSSIVLAALNDARAKARDARRLSDMKQLQNALELYRSDKGNYPLSSTGDTLSTILNPTHSNYNILKVALVDGKYISELPNDPKSINTVAPNSADTYNYWYYSVADTANNTGMYGCTRGQAYWLVFRSEKMPQDKLNGPGFIKCDDNTPYTSAVFRTGLWITGVSGK